MRTLAAIVVVLLLVDGSAAQERAERRLYGMVSGWLGPGWWSFQITTTGDLDVSAESHIYRKLSADERKELERLLSGLPLGQNVYGCNAPLPVDATGEFLLEVSRPLEASRPNHVQRLRYCPQGLKGEPSPEAKAVLEVWRLVVRLVPTPKLVGPDDFAPWPRKVGRGWELPNAMQAADEGRLERCGSIIIGQDHRARW